MGKKGDDIVRIPVPFVELPSFRFGQNARGVGSGEGKEGDIIGAEPLAGEGGVGSLPNEHQLEVEITIRDLVEILKEQIELPNILPKKKGNLEKDEPKAKSVQIPTGSGFVLKRAFLDALRETNDPEEAILLSRVKPHARFRSFERVKTPSSLAVVFYLMDVSGSMTDYLKGLARQTAYWIDKVLEDVYPKVSKVYIIYDTQAKIVDDETFYRTTTGGGTFFSSAYELVLNEIYKDYNPENYNIFCVQFSDGI